MPTYEVKVTGQITKSFRIIDAESDVDARDIAENEFNASAKDCLSSRDSGAGCSLNTVCF
jgi:hypothetical protein